MKKLILLTLACVSVVCVGYSQPSNNTCSNAQLITLPTPGQTTCVNGTTVGATATFGNSFWACQGNGQDVWYRYTTGTDVSFSVDFIRGTIGNWVEIDFFSQCPPGGYLGFIGCYANDFSFTMNLQPNTTYYMLVYNSKSGNNTGQGTFQLCITNTQIPLPVDLVSFTVTSTLAGNTLVWKTASEHSSDYFLLERSITGEFTEKSIIHMIPAAGSSTELLTYSRIDNTFEPTLNYYQLTQVDTDGKYKTYGPIAIDNTMTGKLLIKTVNLLGQEVDASTTGVLFEIYTDGTSKKIIR